MDKAGNWNKTDRKRKVSGMSDLCVAGACNRAGGRVGYVQRIRGRDRENASY